MEACRMTAFSHLQIVLTLSQCKQAQNQTPPWAILLLSFQPVLPSSGRLTCTVVSRALAHPSTRHLVILHLFAMTIFRAILWLPCRNGKSCCSSHPRHHPWPRKRIQGWGTRASSPRQAPAMPHVPAPPRTIQSAPPWARTLSHVQCHLVLANQNHHMHSECAH